MENGSSRLSPLLHIVGNILFLRLLITSRSGWREKLMKMWDNTKCRNFYGNMSSAGKESWERYTQIMVLSSHLKPLKTSAHHITLSLPFRPQGIPSQRNSWSIQQGYPWHSKKMPKSGERMVAQNSLKCLMGLPYHFSYTHTPITLWYGLWDRSAVAHKRVPGSVRSMVSEEENNLVLTFKRDTLDKIREKAVQRVQRYLESITKQYNRKVQSCVF